MSKMQLHEVLSIPYIGFAAVMIGKAISDVFNFQFPILGSREYNGQILSEAEAFQFPILGSGDLNE